MHRLVFLIQDRPRPIACTRIKVDVLVNGETDVVSAPEMVLKTLNCQVRRKDHKR